MIKIPICKTAIIGMITMAIAACGYDVYSVKGLDVGPPMGHGAVLRCSLLLDIKIQVWSNFDGLVLPDPGVSENSSREGLALLTREYEQRFGRNLRLMRRPVDDPRLLDEYLALYRLVADQALFRAGSSDLRWRYQQGRTDLGVGPDLHQVAGATLCGTAIVLDGFQLPESGAEAFPGVPVGRGVLTLGLLDLGSGAIIQIDRIVLPAGHDLRQPEHLQLAIERVLRDLPL